MSIKLTVPENNLTPELKPRITVIGVGGAGGNAVNNMIASHLEGVDFVVANTDAQALALSRTDRRVQMGLGITDGLGAGANPHVGQTAATDTLDEIMAELDGSHMVFVAAGMGGGTGTGAAPIIARAARERGILTVGVVTKPFHFEGAHRMRLADSGIEELQSVVDTLIIIPNQNLFRVANEKTTFADAFKMADDVLHSGVRSVTDLMVMPGLINLDFADVQAIMAGMGKAMMGTGEAEGEKRALDAAEAAISNPLLEDTSIKGAQGVLINITGGPDMTLFEVDEAANRIRDEVDQDAHIIFGSTFDEKLEGLIRVSVVATGIDTEAMIRPEPRVLELTAKERIKPAPIAVETEVPAAAVAQAAAPMQATGTDVEQPAVARAVNADPAGGETPFIPAPPMQPSGRRFAAPKAEPFNQAALENKPAKPAAPAKPARPRMTLFERVTGVGRVDRAAVATPKAETPAKVEKVASKPEPKPAPVPVPAPALTKEEREPQLLPGERTVTSYEEEDMLDIPAFLRRQAN